jgi:dTDP-4-amino-4,6-dideoxygalactose transaminase
MKIIPYCKVVCDGNELKYIQEVLESGWLTTAARTRELEERFAEAVGARYACAVNSCTAALHLAAEALGIRPGDRVFVPTMTFTATAEVLRYLGAEPVFLDVEYGSCLLTPEIVGAAAQRFPAVKAVMIVHYGGQAARMTGAGGLLEVCRSRGIRIIEDAAHAFPSRIGGRMVGGLGDATCFSFYANKTITTGEGGMLTTNDAAIAERAKVARLHGIDRDAWSSFTAGKPAWEYDILECGYKYNLSDINAAIGLAQLERAEELRAGRQRCAEFYLRELAGLACIDLPLLHCTPQDHAWHIFPIVLKPEAPVTRNRCIELLAARGIGASVHYKPLHRMTCYRETYGLKPEDYPGAERIWRGCLSLPMYPTLADEDLAYICGVLRECLTG